MNRFLTSVLAVSAAFALPSAAAQQRYEMQSYVNSPAAPTGWQPAGFWCDAGSRVLAVTQPKPPVKLTSPVTLIQWTGAKASQQPFQFGPNDTGAGNVYTALTPAGQTVSTSPKYYVHSSNVENTADPASKMDRVSRFVLPGGTYDCAYQPQAIFMGATAKRNIAVFDDARGVRYLSTNRDRSAGVNPGNDQHIVSVAGSAGVNLTGGQHKVRAGGDDYRWTKAGYTYALHIGRPGATLTVLRGNRVVQSEKFQAYSVSVQQ